MTENFSENQIFFFINKNLEKYFKNSERQIFKFITQRTGKVILIDEKNFEREFPFFLKELESVFETAVFKEDYVKTGFKSSQIKYVMCVGLDGDVLGLECFKIGGKKTKVGICQEILTISESKKVLDTLGKLKNIENKFKN